MGMTLFMTDPVVAAAYFIHPAEFVWVADNAEAVWLLGNHHAYSLQHRGPLPAAYYVHPDAPPFVPLPDPTPPGTQPAHMTVTVKWVSPAVFDVIFGAGPDTVAATGAFLVLDDANAVIAEGGWTQPPGTTPDEAVGLLETAMAEFPVIDTTQFGPRLEIRGAAPTVVRAVRAVLNIPKP